MKNEEMKKLQEKSGTRIILNGKSCIKNITDKKMYDECLIYSVNKNKQIKDTIKWTPMDDDWKDACKKDWWFQDTFEGMKSMYENMDDGFFELKSKLIEFAGESVCLPAYEPDLESLLKYGQFWIGNNIKFMRGEPCQCHANSAHLWQRNKDVTHICTGYALSDDGMWRQHSWLIWNKARSNQIVETTEPRVAYFGFVMPDEMCKKFADENYY